MAGQTAISAYGMFWARDQVRFYPGKGAGHIDRNPFELLGRHGKQAGTLRLLDARFMHGVYILHSNYGAYYVGLANGEWGLGARLRAHTKDQHKKNWNSFSWFAFDPVLPTVAPSGYQAFEPISEFKITDAPGFIRDMEAMLMNVLGTLERGNKYRSKFQNASEWEQVALHERDAYRERLS